MFTSLRQWQFEIQVLYVQSNNLVILYSQYTVTYYYVIKQIYYLII